MPFLILNVLKSFYLPLSDDDGLQQQQQQVEPEEDTTSSSTRRQTQDIRSWQISPGFITKSPPMPTLSSMPNKSQAVELMLVATREPLLMMAAMLAISLLTNLR